MRYYIYLDKCFLRNLFSTLTTSNFDIEVVEYSVRKCSTVNNQLSVDPNVESICEVEKDKSSVNKKNIQKRYKDEKLSKQGLHAQYGYGNTSTIETQRRYINIEDITQMKNNTFYHNLIEKLNNQNSRNDKRIIIEDGFIELYKREDMFKEDKTNDSFFMINDKYIWYDKNILQGDIDLMAQMACKIKVIGYTVSCLEKEQKVVKAIAIFIE